MPDRTPKMPATGAGLLLAAALVLAGGGASRAQVVGTAGAANKLSSGAPPGQPVRTIDIGAQIVRNEKVSTSPSGSIQVLFIDKTSLNVGPNSTLTIDEFVFSPAAASGKLTLALAKGVLRVVGGQATHTGGATVLTPAATIGIRGGIATISFCPTLTPTCIQQGLRVTNHFGQVTITTPSGASQTITRPGFTVSVGTNGTPSAPARASQAEVDAENASLTSGKGQSGGSSTVPSDRTAVQAGLGRTDATLSPALSVPRQGQTVASASVQSSNLIQSVAPVATRIVQTAIAQPAAAISAGIPFSPSYPTNPTTPPPPPPPPATVTVPSKAYALTTTVDAASLGQNRVPYLLASFTGQGTYNVSQVLGYRAGGTETQGTHTAETSRVLQAGLKISGSGASQSSGLLVATGVVVYDNQYGNTLTGHVEAIARDAGNNFIHRASSALSSPANANPSAGSVPVDADALPTSFTVNQNGFGTSNANNYHQYSSDSAYQNFPGDNGTYYGFTQTLTRTTADASLGSDHPNRTLNGYVGGLGQTQRFAPLNSNGTTGSAFLITNATGSTGDVSVTLLGTSSRMGATFNVVNSSRSPSDTLQSASLQFGDAKTGDDGARGTYVDSSHFGASSERTFTVQNGAAVTRETSTVNGSTALPNPQTDNLHLLMVSSDTVLGTSATTHTSALFPGVAFCACDYTKWGFWAARNFVQDANANAGTITAANLAFWVAGLPSGASDVPLTGSATYAGHVIADISNAGAVYVAAGNLTTTVNFGRGSGTVGVAGLDGANYGGSVAVNTANPAAFGATLTGVNAATSAANGRTLALNGTYFQSAAGPAGEVGGNATLRGTNYLGGGIFLAHRTP